MGAKLNPQVNYVLVSPLSCCQERRNEGRQVVRSPGRVGMSRGTAGRGPSASPSREAEGLLQSRPVLLRLRCCAQLVPRDGTACSGTASPAGAPGRQKCSKLNGAGRF